MSAMPGDVEMQQEEDQLDGGGNPPKRCAACRCLRRRCAPGCVLAPYFPASHPDRYACVHRVFGAGNATRMLESVPVEAREQAAESLALEAQWRVQDPVYGSAGIIHGLQEEILAAQGELARMRAQLDLAATRAAQLNLVAAQGAQLQEQALVPLAPPPPHSPQRTGGHDQAVAVAPRQEEAQFPDPDEFLNLNGFRALIDRVECVYVGPCEL